VAPIPTVDAEAVDTNNAPTSPKRHLVSASVLAKLSTIRKIEKPSS